VWTLSIHSSCLHVAHSPCYRVLMTNTVPVVEGDVVRL